MQGARNTSQEATLSQRGGEPPLHKRSDSGAANGTAVVAVTPKLNGVAIHSNPSAQHSPSYNLAEAQRNLSEFISIDATADRAAALRFIQVYGNRAFLENLALIALCKGCGNLRAAAKDLNILPQGLDEILKGVCLRHGVNGADKIVVLAQRLANDPQLAPSLKSKDDETLRIANWNSTLELNLLSKEVLNEPVKITRATASAGLAELTQPSLAVVPNQQAITGAWLPAAEVVLSTQASRILAELENGARCAARVLVDRKDDSTVVSLTHAEILRRLLACVVVSEDANLPLVCDATSLTRSSIAQSLRSLCVERSIGISNLRAGLVVLEEISNYFKRKETPDFLIGSVKRYTQFVKLTEGPISSIGYSGPKRQSEPLEEQEDARLALRTPIAVASNAPQYKPQYKIVTIDPQMSHALEHVELAAKSGVTVLIGGETGTGKELVARHLHENSDRRQHPFVVVNCPAIPNDLLESELFGHEVGAFTGAVKCRIGRFEFAKNGTIFLDEISELPLTLQGKLLRVLQEREIERVGCNQVIKVNCRVVAATNKDLFGMVKQKLFREDLYYRLSVMEVALPPLRERKQDIKILVEHFLKLYNPGVNNHISDDVLKILTRHTWPGNIRELQNAVERAAVFSDGQEIEASHFKIRGLDMLSTGEEFASDPSAFHAELNMSLADIERAYILATLKNENYNRSHAAQKLGISVRCLRNKLSLFAKQGAIIDKT